jgi:hypothetical protein
VAEIANNPRPPLLKVLRVLELARLTGSFSALFPMEAIPFWLWKDFRSGIRELLHVGSA